MQSNVCKDFQHNHFINKAHFNEDEQIFIHATSWTIPPLSLSHTHPVSQSHICHMPVQCIIWLSLRAPFFDKRWNIWLSDAKAWYNIHITHITHIHHRHRLHTHMTDGAAGRTDPCLSCMWQIYSMFHGESAMMKHAGVFVSYEWEICLRSPIAQSRYLLIANYSCFVA